MRSWMLLLLSLLLPVTSTAATRWASPTGSGTTCSSAAPCTVVQGLTSSVAGDILKLKCGTYTGVNGMINPPDNKAGSSGNPITVQAEADGCALINGQGARSAILLSTGNSWYIIEGMNACCSATNTDLVATYAGATNNILRRIVAWNAGSDNTKVFNCWNSSDTLFEDIAGWGSGRKIFGRQKDTRCTFRRGFGMKTCDTGGGGSGAQGGYNSVAPLMENIIITRDDGASPCQQLAGDMGMGHTRYEATHPGTAETIKMYGNIVYTFDAQNSNLNHMIQQASNPNGIEKNGLTITALSSDNLSITRVTTTPSAQILTSVGTGIHGGTSVATTNNWTYSYGDLDGTPVAFTAITDAGSKTKAQFVGGGLMQTDSSTRPAFGAWLRYKYINGVQTAGNGELWPWPMNQRIKDALVSSGFSARGINGTGETDLTAIMFGLTGDDGTLPPKRLAFVTQPVSTQEDTTMANITVEVRNNANARDTAATDLVTLALSSNPGSSTLSGCDVTMNAVAGLATFTGCVLNNIGTGYSLGATATGLVSAVSNAFTIFTAPVTPPDPIATAGKRYRVIR